jgi:hypothetical protein
VPLAIDPVLPHLSTRFVLSPAIFPNISEVGPFSLRPAFAAAAEDQSGSNSTCAGRLANAGGKGTRAEAG